MWRLFFLHFQTMLRVFFIKSFTFSSSSFSHGKRLRASNRISNKKFQNFKKLDHLLWQFYSFKSFFFLTKNLLEIQISARETKKPLKNFSRVSLNKNVTLTFTVLLLIMVTLSMMMTIMMRMMMSVVAFTSGFFHKHFTHGAWGKVTPC